MKPSQYPNGIPILSQTLSEPGSYISSGEFSTYLTILRRNHEGVVYCIEVEVTGDWDKINEAGLVPTMTVVAPGLAIVPDAFLVLEEVEIEAVREEWRDWQREIVEEDEAERMEAVRTAREEWVFAHR